MERLRYVFVSPVINGGSTRNCNKQVNIKSVVSNANVVQLILIEVYM